MAKTVHCLTMTLAHLSKILLITPFVLALVAPASQASECECGCVGYFTMLESIEDDAGKSPAKLDRCAGACAIAWSRCELRYDIGDQLAAVETENSESGGDDPQPDDHESRGQSQ